MPTKKTKKMTRRARKLAGAVILTASFSLFAIPDALAESGGAECSLVLGAMAGSDDASPNSGSCSIREITEEFAMSDGPSSLGGY